MEDLSSLVKIAGEEIIEFNNRGLAKEMPQHGELFAVATYTVVPTEAYDAQACRPKT